MKKNLKTLTVFFGNEAGRFTNTNPADGSRTPIELDTDTKIVTIHYTDKDKMVIDLNKVVMYRYEEEQLVLQS